MTTLWLNILVPALFVAAFILIIVRRGYQMRLLCRDGVDAIGMVKTKSERRMTKGRHKNFVIHYAYLDEQGKAHEHRSIVSRSFWDRHEEGGRIDIVYSRSRPEISAPAQLVDKARSIN